MVINDVILMILYGWLFVLIVRAYAKVKGVSKLEGNRMFYGVIIKVTGAILYLLIHDFYFGYGGDSLAYFNDGAKINELLLISPSEYLRYIFGWSDWSELSGTSAIGMLNFPSGTKEFVMDVLCSIVSILGMGNYYTTTLVFAFLSYIGFWYLYKGLAQRYPHLSKWAFLVVFCIPSVLVWGSGIVKENVVLSLLGLFFYGVLKISEKPTHIVWWGLLVAIALAFIGMVKTYVLISLLFGIFVWKVLGMWKGSHSLVVRRIVKPLVVMTVVVMTMTVFNVVRQSSEMLRFDYFISKAGDMQNWHFKKGSNSSKLHGRGSSYTLGEYDPTIWGMVAMIPASVNVTFFRPYIWEVKSPLVGLVAIESLFVMVLFFYILSRRSLYHRFSNVFKDYFLLMMLSYAVFLAFIVGFTSYNFGALDRYKIPLMPFFIFSLVIIIDRIQPENSLE